MDAWPRLALVEGLPGSGKSTTAQWLAHQAERQAQPVRWIHEGEWPHPVVGPEPIPTGSWREHLQRRLDGPGLAHTQPTGTYDRVG